MRELYLMPIGLYKEVNKWRKSVKLASRLNLIHTFFISEYKYKSEKLFSKINSTNTLKKSTNALRRYTKGRF